MSASHKFQLALHLKSLRNIGIRQTSILQLRTVVFHINDKKQNITAKPYQLINLSQSQIKNQTDKINNQKSDKKISSNKNIQNWQADQNNWAIIEDDTFLSPRILIKNTDKYVNIDTLCVFKGQINIPMANKHEHEIYIYSQLIWYLGKEVQVIGQWKGFSKLTNFQSYLDVYFSTHVLACSIVASAHCLLTQINIKGQDRILPMLKQRIFYNHISNKATQLYDASMDPLIQSFNALARWISQFQGHHVDLTQNKLKGKNSNNIQFQQLQTIKWKYNYLIFNSGQKSNQQLANSLNSLSAMQCLNNLKYDSQKICESLYLFWKQFLKFIKKYPKSSYFESLTCKYHTSLQKQHWQNRIILSDSNKNVNSLPLSKKGLQLNRQILKNGQKQQSLQFCSVEQHVSKIKLSSKDLQTLNRATDNKKKDRIIVLVHGFQASGFDMQSIGMYFKFRNPDCHLLISQANEGLTQGAIQQCGHRLAIQIKNYVNAKQLKDFSMSFIGHSLGGVIIRASLRYLQLYKNSFHCYVSIASPHMGYLYHTSTIVTTSMWVMNQVKKDQSMIELALSDNKTLTKCYMYELSERTELNWFQTIILVGSKQDEYVPFTSAILQNMEFYIQSQSAKVYQNMLSNIIKPIQNKVIRLQIIFNDKIKDLSGFIGRTAHIKVLSFLPVIELYCHLISKRI